MAGSGTIKTLAALVVSLALGTCALIWMETAPARPIAPLPLQAVGEGETGAPLAVVESTDVRVPSGKWRHVVVHDAGRDGVAADDGCHFVIGSAATFGDGAIRATARWRNQSDGRHIVVPGYDFNADSIGVCVLADARSSAPTPQQTAALTQLVRQLQQSFRIPPASVYLHSDLGAPDCPGGRFPAEAFRAGLVRPSR